MIAEEKCWFLGQAAVNSCIAVQPDRECRAGACYLTTLAKPWVQYESTAHMRFLRLNGVRAAFGVALLTLSIAAFMSFRSISRLITNAGRVSHTYDVLDRLDDLMIATREAESEARGFYISGSEPFRQRFENAVQSIQATLDVLDRLVADNPHQQPRMAMLRQLVAQKVELHRQRMEARLTQGRDAAINLFLSDLSERIINRILQVASDIKGEEQTLLRTRTAREQSSARASIVALAAGSLFSFGILFGVYFSLEREIGRRRRSESRLVHLNRLYAVLSQTNQAIVRARTREELFPEVCRVAVEYGQFTMAWIGLLEPETGLIKPAAWRGYEAGYLQTVPISAGDEPAGRGPTGSALREGTHFVCDHIAGDGRMLPWRDEALRRGYRSSAAFPIQVQQKLIGALTVYADQPGFFDDDVVGLLDEVASDISFALQTVEQDERRRLAEHRLKRQGEILDQVHDSIVSTDLGGHVTTWNKGAERLFGYTEAEATGRHISFVYPEEERGFLEREIIEPLRANGTHETEVRMRKASGEDFFAHLSLSLLRDDAGTPVGMIGYSIDVTQRKQAENEVRRLNEELEQRIAERTAQLAEVNNQLAQRNEDLVRASRMKSEFLARMSHEFRTPLNSIVGFSDLLAEANEGPLEETYCDYVRHVQEGARHLLALVNDILDLSRIEAGRTDLRHEEFAAADVIAEVLSVTGPLAEMKEVDLRSDVPATLRVYADRTRIKQIFYNLLSNAVKFTPPRGVVRVSSSLEYDEVRFGVSDTGIGIPGTEHAAIFQEFHQVGPAASGVKEGAGLGLAITKRLVELHGGRIWVESAPGAGSHFYFTVPAARAGEPVECPGSAGYGYWRTGAG